MQNIVKNISRSIAIFTFVLGMVVPAAVSAQGTGGLGATPGAGNTQGGTSSPAIGPGTANGSSANGGTSSASKDAVCEGVSIATGQGCDGKAAREGVDGIIKLVINVLSIIVGVAAVIMIIIGGLKYVTSGGDTNSVSSAKNTILFSVIGLIVVALAQVIVNFVLDKV